MEWIGVEERTPEVGVPVLITYLDYNDKKPYSDVVATIDKFGVWGWWDGGDVDETICFPVTHWMPLPEPPKESGGWGVSFNRKTREAVYRKYGGRCAYCGREIKIKDMQVDHFIPKRGWAVEGADDLSNLMPACRQCNHYKRANSLETFRIYISEIPRKLRQNYIYKVGVTYGNVIENEKPIRFYFETVEESKEATP